MKKYFNIYLKSKKYFNIYVSGFSKTYRWIFNNAIRVFFSLGNYIPRLKNRNTFVNNIKMSSTIKQSSPHLKERWTFSHSKKLVTNIIFRLSERWIFSNTIKVNYIINSLRMRNRINLLAFNPVRIRTTFSFSVLMLYKLETWDYKVPTDPSQGMYLLSELDNKTLSSMDQQ